MVIGREFKSVIAIETRFIAYALIITREGAALRVHTIRTTIPLLRFVRAAHVKCNPSTWRKKTSKQRGWHLNARDWHDRAQTSWSFSWEASIPVSLSLWSKNDWILGLIRWRRNSIDFRNIVQLCRSKDIFLNRPL